MNQKEVFDLSYNVREFFFFFRESKGCCNFHRHQFFTCKMNYCVFKGYIIERMTQAMTQCVWSKTFHEPASHGMWFVHKNKDCLNFSETARCF